MQPSHAQAHLRRLGFERECRLVDKDWLVIDRRFLFIIILVTLGNEILSSSCRIICWINSDLKITQSPCFSELVTIRKETATTRIKVGKSATSISNNEIWDPVYQVPLVIVGMPCEICTYAVGMVEELPRFKIEIHLSFAIIPYRMMMHGKYSQQCITVQLLFEPLLLTLSKGKRCVWIITIGIIRVR